MQHLSSLRVGQKFALAFAFVFALSLFSALYSRHVLADLSTRTHVLVSDRMVKVQQLAQVKDNLNQVARSVRNLLLFPEDEHQREQLGLIHEATAKNTALYATLDQSISLPKGRELLKQAESARANFGAELRKFEHMVSAKEFGKALELLGSALRPTQLAYQKSVDDLTDYQYQMMGEDGQYAESEAQQATITMMLAFVLTTGLGSALAYVITRSVTLPLREAVDLANRVAQGDLSVSLHTHSRDEVGALVQALDAMVRKLKQLLGEVKHAADQIATGSSEIAMGNHDLSSRTELAASNLQETASSMQQLTSIVDQNLQSAVAVSNVVKTAAESARQGGDVVSQVVTTMGNINQSSRKIGDIISVIDGIAFQTNILALNAAVEAARAGEQGRGFAVVASEVRTLAQRSAQAAKEIKTLIGASMETVESGGRLVDQAGQTMQAVVVSVTQVTSLIGEITSAADQQSAGIRGVNQAIGQLDQATQQNAALVEQSSAATESLKGQSERLSNAISVFRL